MNPQFYGHVMDKLFARGAYDVYLAPIVMKKGRPGTRISALVPNDRLQDAIKIILRETSSLGVRIIDCDTAHVKRETVNVDTDWWRVRVKLGRLDGEVVNVAPEYEDCRGIAEMKGISLKRYGNVLANCGRWIGATSKDDVLSVNVMHRSYDGLQTACRQHGGHFGQRGLAGVIVDGR